MKPTLQKYYIAAACTALVLFGVGAGFLFLWRTMRQKELRVHEVKQTLATYEQNKKIFTKENEDLQDINKRIAALEQKRVTEATVPNLLSSFEDMAQANNTVVTINSVQTPSIDGEQQLYVDFSATGSFEQLTAFTHALLTQEYQVRFVKYSLYRDEATGAWEILASLQVLSF